MEECSPTYAVRSPLAVVWHKPSCMGGLSDHSHPALGVTLVAFPGLIPLLLVS